MAAQTSSAKKKEGRARSRVKGAERKKFRAMAQEDAAKRNAKDPAAAPWKIACAARAARRA